MSDDRFVADTADYVVLPTGVPVPSVGALPWEPETPLIG